MSKPLRVLMIEDSAGDAQLLVQELRDGGYDPQASRVETVAALTAALAEPGWDVILSDYRLPLFTGLDALKLVQARGLDVPFLIVSGAIGEDIAVAAMKAGAHDYLLKDKLARLVPAVERELRDAEARRQRRQAERALRESEEHYRALAENAPDVVARFDTQFRHRYVNAASAHVTGLAPAQVLGKTNRELGMPEPLSALLEDGLRRVFTTGQPTVIEYQYTGLAGPGYFETRLAPEFGAAGAVESVLAITRDFTARQRSQQERERLLAEAEEKQRLLDALMEYVPEGITIADAPAVKIRMASRYGQELFGPHIGMTAGAVVEQWKTYHKDGVTPMAVADLPLVRAIAQNVTVTNVEIVQVNTAGRRLPLLCNAGPIRDRTGTVVGGVVVWRDITELKQIEAALRASEERYRSLVELAPEAIIVDRGGRVEFVNSAALELFGAASADQLLGKSPFDLVHPDYHALVRARLAQTRAGGPAMPLEEKILRLDGSARDVEALAAPFTDQAGVAIQVILRDITARKAAEAQLRLQLTVLQSTANAIMITGPDGVIRWVNEAFTRLTGYGAAEALGQPSRLLKSDQHDAEFFERMWATIQAGRVWHGELVNRRKDGSLYTEEMTITPVRDAQGALSNFIAIKQDVTERRQTEELARQRLAEIEAYYRTAPIGLCVLDRELHFVRINDRMAEINGLPAEAHLGRTIGEIIPRVADQQVEQLLRRVIEAGEPLKNIEFRGETAAQPGVERVWLANWYPLHNRTGAIVGVNMVAEEVTERKQMEDRLRLANETLEQNVFVRTAELIQTNDALQKEMAERQRLEESIQQVAENEQQRLGRVLHDGLAQHLTALSFLTEALRQRLAAKKRKEAVDVSKIGQRVLGALELTRQVARGLHPPVLEQEGLPAALEHLASDMTELFGIPCRFQKEGRGLAADASAARQLYRIAREAVINAEKHSQGRHIWIKLHAAPRAITLTVRDDGIGLQTPRRRHGTQGLSIMQYRARAIGATLTISAHRPHGTQMVCAWPQAAARRGRKQPTPPLADD